MINEDQAKNRDIRQAQVPEQHDQLAHEIQKLHKCIDVLATKLESVLRVSPPQVSSEEPKEELTLVILAEAFRDLCNDAKNARFNIEDLIERLEL